MVEATGVYYEELAYFLVDNQQLLSVLLPNKVKHFARSTELKSKTDQLDAHLLCRLGLERAWHRQRSPQSQHMRRVRQRTVEPAFGNLLQHYGLRWVGTKGRAAAHKTMLLSAIAYKLKKLLKHQPKRVVSLALALQPAQLQRTYRFFKQYRRNLTSSVEARSLKWLSSATDTNVEVLSYYLTPGQEPSKVYVWTTGG